MSIKLYDLTNISSPSGTFAEIKHILLLINPAFDTLLLNDVYSDIICLFSGEYPGYRASNTKYHNLEHTCSVILATVRLIHGLDIQKKSFTARIIQLGLIAALFHDSGLIQTEEESNGTGARYTIGHEERSIVLMKKYLSEKGFSVEDTHDCSHIIMSTDLSQPINDIPFGSAEIKSMGKVLGSADLIAQMADRSYLEKLPLLFLEFKEAGIPGFETPLELFKNTEEFYHSVAQTRLSEEMGNVSSAVRYHFRERWGIDRDLYAESIRNNINYLKKIYQDCADSYDCLKKKIRRKV